VLKNSAKPKKKESWKSFNHVNLPAGRQVMIQTV